MNTDSDPYLGFSDGRIKHLDVVRTTWNRSSVAGFRRPTVPRRT
jgi:hypothetical protein